MDSYSVPYGSSFDLAFETEDLDTTLVTLNIGHEGQAPVIIAPAEVVNGIAFISIPRADTRVPLDTYKYQLTVEYSDPDKAYKFPTKEDCGEDGLPSFEITEALDETEAVVS